MQLKQLIKLFFTPKQMKALSAIMACTLVMGLIEMLVVASIVPFLLVITQQDKLISKPIVQSIMQFLGLETASQLIVFFGGAIFVFHILGNVFSAFTHWLISKFSYRYGADLSVKLLNDYLRRPYQYHLTKNSAELCKNIIFEISRFIIGYIVNGLNCFSKVIVILSLTTLLFVADFKLAIGLFSILATFYFITYAKVRTRLVKAGKQASTANNHQYQAAREALGAIKELKLMNRTQTFAKRFHKHAMETAKAETLNYLTPMATRYALETIAFGGMICITLYYLYVVKSINSAIPMLGLYAFAGYRLIPATQQVFSGFTLARYHHAAYDKLYSELQDFQSRGPLPSEQKVYKPMTFNQGLVLKDVGFSYNQNFSLEKINLNIQKNTTIGIVGPTGAGKSTLIDIILGLLTPNTGHLWVDDTLLNKDNTPSWQKQIGYVPQTIFLVDDTIEKNIALGVPEDEIDQAAVIHAAKLANLHDFVSHQQKEGYQTIIGESGVRLSGGQRQRIGIARALYHNPQVLVFDEATSSLDGKTEDVIMESIRALNHQKTIIMIAHRITTVKGADCIFVIDKGQLVAKGSYDELITHSTIFRQLAQVA